MGTHPVDVLGERNGRQTAEHGMFGAEVVKGRGTNGEGRDTTQRLSKVPIFSISTYVADDVSDQLADLVDSGR